MSISSSTSRCCQFSIKDIKEATNQFDGSKILGQGGEAKVYYAEIYTGSNKTPVAVKQLKENSKEFEREIYTLSKIHHPNIVSLIGYCDESGHKILVYEYMAKGCLSDYVKKKSSVSLSWLQRLNICLGAARGLQHLHTGTDESPKGIIHRDVKPGNILVGENWVGKLSDFGMLKLSNAGQDKSLMTTNLKGTNGYYAPEYIKYRRITRKIDVYAFGVVLFEVLCRKMPWDREDESYYGDEDEDLGFWAQQNVDALIQGEITGYSLAVFTDIIGRSLQANPGRRPTMDDVVLDLKKALECQESVYLANQLEGSPRDLPNFKETRQPFYWGVRKRNTNRWVCELREPTKQTRMLGTYPTAEMAARAHDVAALALRGQSACLNFEDSVWRLPVPASLEAKDIRKSAMEAAEAFRPGGVAGVEVSLEAIMEAFDRASPSEEGIMGMVNTPPDNLYYNDEAVMFNTTQEADYYHDQEAMFDMPGLMQDMAQGMMCSPPPSSCNANLSSQYEETTD